MLVVQTNNATFGYTDESEQQLAMSRLRAVEHGRSVVIAATSGISAVVAPDGSVVRSSELFEPAVFVEEIAQRDSTTVAAAARSRPRVGAHRARCRRRARGAAAAADGGPEGGAAMSDRVLVIVPTYNEVENLERILERLHASVPDGARPGGRRRLARRHRRARREARGRATRGCTCCGGPPRPGLGAAYIAGFRWARAQGYDVVVEMDADGSHAPEQLPQLLAALADADLVLGSRYVPGGAVTDWPAHRLLLSRAGNRYTRWALRLPLNDATGGFRAARAELIDRLPFDDVASQGYCFQVDWAWRAVRAGARVTEVPITFTERDVRQEQDERLDR